MLTKSATARFKMRILVVEYIDGLHLTTMTTNELPTRPTITMIAKMMGTTMATTLDMVCIVKVASISMLLLDTVAVSLLLIFIVIFATTNGCCIITSL